MVSHLSSHKFPCGKVELTNLSVASPFHHFCDSIDQIRVIFLQTLRNWADELEFWLETLHQLDFVCKAFTIENEYIVIKLRSSHITRCPSDMNGVFDCLYEHDCSRT